MRVFLAFGLTGSRSVRSALEVLIRELQVELPTARFLAARNVHLTVRFLGDTDSNRLGRLLSKLRSLVRSEPGFDLALRGVGAFPRARRPRVLWVGVADPPKGLFRFQSKIESAAQECGYPAESRAFTPHLSVARFRQGTNVAARLAGFARRELGTLSVGELTCFESRLSPEGASYRVVEHLALGPR